ncbi:branched-chain amino acid transport system ATP-binding protein [Rhodoligotrophos appendicifer]|uniref:ABC transporter ATP-binding protein n=1 Tax=Rhodoligotrophos appendicifer TaxID=987056 RepID=UPI001185B149|nr:ABC transporter ATP-binding protein [Rhodoligotrophos appendicifer]
MLSVENLSAGYGGVEALRGVSLHVERGEIVALLGANGAGKSTLLATLSGLMPSTGGNAALEGRPLLGMKPHRIARLGVALVPEQRDLFIGMSVYENLTMGAYLRHERSTIGRDIEQVFGFFPVLKDRRRQIASTLSGGEQQMLAIGRALMGRPKLLMLDEPSLGIAPRLIEAIFGIILRINREAGVTILLVEQNTQVALAVSARAYILANGTVIADGPSRDLADSEVVRRSYLGLD